MNTPNKLIATVAFVFLLTTPIRVFAAPISSPSDALVGTWQLVSLKYGDETKFQDYPSESRKIKIISPTHFVWIEYSPADGKIEGSAGGTYQFDGTRYAEMIAFCADAVRALLGKKQVFTVELEGDRLHQTGTLSNGFKIEEYWQRVK